MALAPTIWPFLAAAHAGQAATTPAQNPLVGMAMPMLLTFAVVYFMLLRPTNKQRAEQAAFLQGLKKDDEVVTQSGLIGRIAALEEKIVTLELGERIRVRMMRDRIVSRMDAVQKSTAAQRS